MKTTKKINLNNYSKPEHGKLVNASFTITDEQRIYLESKKINRSELVRDFLQSIIDADPNYTKPVKSEAC